MGAVEDKHYFHNDSRQNNLSLFYSKRQKYWGWIASVVAGDYFFWFVLLQANIHRKQVVFEQSGGTA
jgi:hypothetical protein